MAGPIVRASQFLPQLHQGPRFTRENLEVGAFRIVKGLTKKVVLGDWIAVQLTDRIFDAPETYTSPELMIALYAYTLQIYADFSGYSDMAIGLGRMLGFKLPENFDRPYQSRDIAEYWRRWHMTLSSWLRDYLFFQLLARFGARGGYIAMWLTMFLVGMWHGASWNFVIYANMHALAMVFNRWNRTRKRAWSTKFKLAIWPLILVNFGGAAAALGHYVLKMPWDLAGILGAFMLVVFARDLLAAAKGRQVDHGPAHLPDLPLRGHRPHLFPSAGHRDGPGFRRGIVHVGRPLDPRRSREHLGLARAWLWIGLPLHSDHVGHREGARPVPQGARSAAGAARSLPWPMA